MATGAIEADDYIQLPGDAAEGSKEFLLRRTGLRPLRFFGRLLFEIEQIGMKVYQTTNNAWVMQTTQELDGKEYLDVKVMGMHAPDAEFLEEYECSRCS